MKCAVSICKTELTKEDVALDFLDHCLEVTIICSNCHITYTFDLEAKDCNEEN